MSRKITAPFQTLVTEQQNLWKANIEFQGFSTCIPDNSQTMSEIKGPLRTILFSSSAAFLTLQMNICCVLSHKCYLWC